MSLETNTVPELKAMAKELGLTGYSKLNKLDLIRLLKQAQDKATKSTIIKEIAKEQGVKVIDIPMTEVSDWKDMKGYPEIIDAGQTVQIASPKSSDEVWDEARSVFPLVMNRAMRRKQAALARRASKRVA